MNETASFVNRMLKGCNCIIH